MADQVSISNLALARVGHSSPIAALTEHSAEAVACAAIYSQCLDEVLEAMDWPFARRRQRPTALVASTLDLGAAPKGWAYAYSLPADCIPNGLRLVSGERNARPDETSPFRVEGDTATSQAIVLTDEPSPEFIYTARITNFALFPASFASAVAWRMAIELAGSIKKDEATLRLAELGYQAALARAGAASRKGERPDKAPPPSWIANR